MAAAALCPIVLFIFHTSGFGVWFVAGVLALGFTMVQFGDLPLGECCKLVQARWEVGHGQGAVAFDDLACAEVETRIQARASTARIGWVWVRWHRTPCRHRPCTRRVPEHRQHRMPGRA